MTENSPRNYYRDYVTPEAWLELRRWIVASVEKAIDGAYEDQAELLDKVLSKMNELVAPVPRVIPAQQPRVELGVSLGGVFISETILGELQDRGTHNSEADAEDPLLLERDVGDALARYGLAVRQTRGGWHATELLEKFVSQYDEAKGAEAKH